MAAGWECRVRWDKFCCKFVCCRFNFLAKRIGDKNGLVVVYIKLVILAPMEMIYNKTVALYKCLDIK